MISPNWSAHFPDEAFRWRMSVRPGEGRDFFAATADHDELIAERNRLLDANPHDFAAALPESSRIVAEAIDLIDGWTGSRSSGVDSMEVTPTCIAAGRRWEPDWVLLDPVSDSLRVMAGVVCFPSSWALPDKIGLPLAEVHGPVPDLNAALGARIDAFLARVEAGRDWERENWGLAHDTDLNHHPRHHRSESVHPISLAATWLRMERQLFVRLPRTRGLLFGIRVLHFSLAEMARDPGLAARLAGALESMPETAAHYKGMGRSRPALIAELRKASADGSTA